MTENKPLGIPYGIWIIIIWLSFSSFSKLIWLNIFLHPSDSVFGLFPLFFADMIILGISLIVIYGLFKSCSWAWIVLIGLIIIDIITAFVLSTQIGPATSVVKTIFGMIIIIYLFQPGVKSYFDLNEK